ncbi:TetR/AcrR family transcriptional regulator [Cumulibacter manganitolerans]|uniref:TetR/AcrR family transcriptional regulator n=1 Tax=Cumulibacter manganitolerans TaxID=1884992 RepID=UPI0012969268|nr:TetR family transcriptional regulator C-terminal domain-containing protein [Cumulibacter manganitolerans]
MPRIVDHEERRRELATSVWSIIRTDGIEAVTIRALAERSGWSSGAVRHYLPTREAILEFAAGQVAAEARRFIESRPVTGDAVQDFRTALLATLPLTADTRAYLETWLAFVGAAVTGQGPAQKALLYDDLHSFLVETLTGFAADGRLATGSVGAVAISLHALLDGLAVHLLLHQITGREAEDAVDRWLAGSLVVPDPVREPAS